LSHCRVNRAAIEARREKREERRERREERGEMGLGTSQKPYLSSLTSVFSLLSSKYPIA